MLPNIRNAHDPETRNIINAAIDSLNAQGKSIQDLVAEGQLTPKQYEDLIISINTLVKSGQISKDDLNLELKNEINDHENRIKQAEKDKADKNQVRLNTVPIGLNDASDELLSAIEGGQGSNFSLKSEPRNGSVKPISTNFLNVGKNKFDKHNVKTNTSLANGEEVHSEWHDLDSHMPIVGGEVYTQSHQLRTAFYDVDGNLIPEGAMDQETPYATPRNFTAPSNAVTASTAILKQYKDVYQIELGSVSTDYEPYKVISDSISLGELNIEKNSIGKDSLQDGAVTFDKKTHLGGWADIFISANSSPINIDSFNRTVTFPEYVRITYGNQTFLFNDKPFTLNFGGNGAQQLVLFDTQTQKFRMLTPGNPQFFSEYEVIIMSIGMKTANEVRKVYCVENFTVNGKPFPEIERGTVDVESSLYSIDERPVGSYNSQIIEGTGTNDDLVMDTTVYTDVYGWYDDLVTHSPDYISQTVLGNDALGNPVNMYHFKDLDWRPRSDGQYDQLPFPKIILITGVHGQEKTSTYAQYNLLKDMVMNWQGKDHLEFLRHNAELLVVPVACPTGYNQNTRGNHNGVDINRNFEANWKLISEEANTYGGPSPLSEKEAQYINQLMLDNPDALFVCDFHAFYGNSTDTEYFLWCPWNHEKVGTSARNTFRRLTRKWKQEYEWLPENELYAVGYTTETWGTTATVTEQAKENGIKGATFEVGQRFWLEPGNYSYHKTSNTLAAEAYGNFLVDIIHNLSK